MTPRLNILVYCGSGVSESALKQLSNSLSHSVSSKFDIKQVGVADMNGPWESTCAALIMPGGRDKEYLSAFGEEMINRVQSYVHGGGKYLGICAGAYFASSKIRFEEGRPGYEIVEQRPLGLFPGEAIGAVNADFEYGSEKGAVAASIELTGLPISQCAIYVNGGCRFEFDEDHYREWNVIGRYSHDHMPAIISSTVGKGNVLLSGVHFEYSASLLDSEMSSREKSVLIEMEKPRQELWKLLMSNFLGVELDKAEILDDMPIRRIVGDIDIFDQDDGAYNAFFDSKLYKNHLSTVQIGQNLLYTPRLSSTQTYLQENENITQQLPSGTILLAGEQTKGRGRGGNKWISPSIRTSLQFTMVIDHEDLTLLSLLQILAALSMVKAIRSIRPETPVHIKWPNDIYVRDGPEFKKVGGILVTSQIIGGSCTVLVGCGINLGPCPQIASINDIVIGSQVYPEEVLSYFCNEFEKIYSTIGENIEDLISQYLQLWLHNGQQVRIYDDVNEAAILGIDKFGYLLAQSDHGEIVKLQPDGNSFDMLAGLIKLKATP